jgi:hypothetical protein
MDVLHDANARQRTIPVEAGLNGTVESGRKGMKATIEEE